MARKLNSLVAFLRSSKKTILLILVVALASIVGSALISIFLSRTSNLSVPSLGTIRALGVEAYWDRNLENKTESVNWGMVWPGSQQNVTLILRSVSTIETTLNLNATNWNPANISRYMSLTWNYNGTTIRPGEIVEVRLSLSASSSDSFVLYLISNNVKQFSFDIVISTSEYTS